MRSRLTAVALLALVAGGALAKAQEQVYKPGNGFRERGVPLALR